MVKEFEKDSIWFKDVQKTRFYVQNYYVNIIKKMIVSSIKTKNFV